MKPGTRLITYFSNLPWLFTESREIGRAFLQLRPLLVGDLHEGGPEADARIRDHDIDPAEELIGLLEATDEEDDAMLEERRMMRAALELSNHTARELMTPRTDVTALPVTASFTDAMKVAASSGFSRLPLYEETLDQVVGVVYAKDLLGYVANGSATPRLVDVARVS